MNHINLFQTNAEFLSAYNGSDYVEPWVSYTMETSGLSFNKESGPTPPPHDYSQDYLTFEITGDGVIRWKAYTIAYTATLEYKKNDGEWTSITSATGNSAPSISVVSGDIVLFRGNNATYSSGESRYNCFSGTTSQFNVYGNIMSLLDSTGFTTATTLQSAYTFYCLFASCTGLTNAENLVFPATTLTDYCYSQMFIYCGNLATVPGLPATTLANNCYQRMFSNCTSLTTAPELPATTLSNYCYQGMFISCTGLTTAPELPATTLENYCYYGMFQGCRSLTTAPELPATTLANYCYQQMFKSCTSLSYIKCLATDISTSNYTKGWVDGVSSSGTFIKNASITVSTWGRGANGIPYNWTVKDAS